jgi:hypothetical protein
VSSGYVRRDGSWNLALHQHSPLPAMGRPDAQTGRTLGGGSISALAPPETGPFY